MLVERVMRSGHSFSIGSPGDDVAEIVRIIDGRRDIDEIFAGSNEA
jgi:hypothetical protein